MSPTAMVGRGQGESEARPSTWNIFRIQWLTPLFLHEMPWDFRQPHIYMIVGIVFYPRFCFLSLLVTLPLQASCAIAVPCPRDGSGLHQARVVM